ncbi:MAG TPA: heavy-metal-associated domain-containing protein [Actinomycetota bacterium]|nr:heavy-metal-associated domain-containing protein [Actinomycetota bacterium]
MQETFQVADISCDHCKRAIEGALRPLAGVQRAEVSVPERSVTVEWQPETVARERLVAAIEDAGYTVGGHPETLTVQMKGSER